MKKTDVHREDYSIWNEAEAIHFLLCPTSNIVLEPFENELHYQIITVFFAQPPPHRKYTFCNKENQLSSEMLKKRQMFEC